MNDDSRFISGIYNYCDRWCERCRFTDRCRVFATEQKRLERHLLRGEDPDDPEVFMRDMEETLSESIGMLAQMAEERGIDLDALPPPPRRRRRKRKENPLYARAERWSERVRALLERMRTDLPGIGTDLAAVGAQLTEKEQQETIRQLERLRDAYEVLQQYCLFVVVKLARATRHDVEPWEEEEDTDDPDVAHFQRQDALGTAKLVHECLGKAAAALWCAGEFHREWQEHALPLAAETEALRQAIDGAFPGHREFRRPGLDDGET